MTCAILALVGFAEATRTASVFITSALAAEAADTIADRHARG